MTPLKQNQNERQRDISPEANYLNTIVKAVTNTQGYEHYKDVRASAASQMAIDKLRRKRMQRLNIVGGASLDTTLNTIDKQVTISKQEIRLHSLNDRINMSRKKLNRDQKELREMQIQKYRYENNLQKYTVKGRLSSSVDPARQRSFN